MPKHPVDAPDALQHQQAAIIDRFTALSSRQGGFAHACCFLANERACQTKVPQDFCRGFLEARSAKGRSEAPYFASTLAMALATVSTFLSFRAATQMRPLLTA